MAAYYEVMWWCIAVLITTATATVTATATATATAIVTATATKTRTATTDPFTTAKARLQTTCTLALEHSRVAGSLDIVFKANCTGETLRVALNRGVVMPRQSPGVQIVDEDACGFDYRNMTSSDDYMTGVLTCAVTLCAGTSVEFHSSTIMLNATDVLLLQNPSDVLGDMMFREYGMICGQHINVALYRTKLSVMTPNDYIFARAAGIVLLSSNISLINSNMIGGINGNMSNITVVNSNIDGGVIGSICNVSVNNSNVTANSDIDGGITAQFCNVTAVNSNIDGGITAHFCNVTVVNSKITGGIYDNFPPLDVVVVTSTISGATTAQGSDYGDYGILTLVGNSISSEVVVDYCNVTMVSNSVSGDIDATGCNVTMLNGDVSGNITLWECNATIVKTTARYIVFGFSPFSSDVAKFVNLSTCTVSETSANLKAIGRIYSTGPWRNLVSNDWVYHMNSLCEHPEPRACFSLPQRIALICAGVNGKYTSYHSSPDTCIDPRWLENVVLLYVLFGVAVVFILACAVVLRTICGSHHVPQIGSSSRGCACNDFIRAFLKVVGSRTSRKVHPHVAHLMQMLVPILRIALMVWDIVTDAAVMYKLFEWSGGIEKWTDSRLYSRIKVGASDAIVGSYIVLYFAPYILSCLILHIHVAALVTSLKDAAIQAYPSLLPYLLHATLKPWLWIFLWWLYLCFPLLLWSLVMDIPMMFLHTVSAGHWFEWLQLTNYFNLHSFLAAVIRAPYSAGLVTYVYVTGISAEQPIEVSSTLFWFGVGSSLLHILYWVGRSLLTAIAGWPDTSVSTLMKDMFVNLVKHDKDPTFTASMPA